MLVASQAAQVQYSVLARGYSLAGHLFLLWLYVVHNWPPHPQSRFPSWGPFALRPACVRCST